MLHPVHMTQDRHAAAAALAATGRELHARGFLRATSGNLSARLPDGRVLVTASGRDKGALGPDDFLVVDAEGTPEPGSPMPSAEAGLHVQLYAWDAAIGAVLHVHSEAAAVLGRLCEADGEVAISGWEMQKALRGVVTHDAIVRLPVFGNAQDIVALAAHVGPRLRRDVPGYLLAGHGLYAWGRDLAEATRHCDALDYLLGCELSLRRAR